ncbi:MAG: CvpA family protein [Alphaproteobacteria bacterium]|nr:CvpA family protein [Alphaproteobacteria bacterium]
MPTSGRYCEQREEIQSFCGFLDCFPLRTMRRREEHLTGIQGLYIRKTTMTFNMVDLSIIILLGLSILIGILRGATREVLGIAGWVGAIATVFYGLPLLRPLGRHYIHNPMVADLVIAGLLFILSLVVFIIISRTISTRVKGSPLGGLDRSLGLIFGFLRGILVLCIIYLAMGFFYPPEQMPEAVKHARFTPWLARGAQELKLFIPKDYLPQQDVSLSTINPLDAKDLIEHSLPSLEETVKNLSTLKPTSPKKPQPVPEEHKKEEDDGLEKLIEKNDTETQK